MLSHKTLYIGGKADMSIAYGNLSEINNFCFKPWQSIQGRKTFKSIIFLPGSVLMNDMIISKWDNGESYNQGPFKNTGFFPNGIFDTIDR